jgi:DNA polymerase III alpha subunit|tara:strand:- start:2894 stop:3403 length:510 start_codon:yes stop_codon:yes gene_type:complete
VKYDKFGIAVADTDELCTLLYQNPEAQLEQVFVNEPDQFNNSVDQLFAGFNKLKQYNNADIDVEEFDQTMQDQWGMPDSYKTLDIESYLVDQCPEDNYQRLVEELKEFQKRNMIDLLRWLKYFVDTMRSNNLTWGVGRGSSVASYVLYLLGVHKVDSIKYKLDLKEFLR